VNTLEQDTNITIVRYFIVAAITWALIGMSVGVMAAAQLYWPALNFDSEYFQFGRLRPLHTNGVIFGFVGNIIIGTSLYVVQRTCGVSLTGSLLARVVFWGWQSVLVLTFITLPLGLTSSKEYAEPEWFVDILIALVWLGYGFLFFRTIARKTVDHIFVSNWFYGAVIIVITMIFVVNNLALPVTSTKAYYLFSGASDAIIQWWWGHNAVGFLLTAGFIGMNYYFIPKATGRPIYSYRLSIINFWGIIGFYTWAGTHHLVYSSVPVWIQNIGIVMSILLWLPSWAGAYNSYMTIMSNRERLKRDYIVKFYLSAIFYYALSTAEGPLLAIRWFNGIAHNTHWIIGHVHSGALGWVGLTCIATFYYLVPRLYGRTELWSPKLLRWHFNLAHIGILLYIVALWIAGIGQGYMIQHQLDDGSLAYSFVDILKFIDPYMFMRLLGGAFYVTGIVFMIVNLYQTVKAPAVEGAQLQEAI